MIDKDFQKFGALMIEMNEAGSDTRGKKIPPERISIYFNLLKDLYIDDIKNNADKHFLKNKWFPAPCELRGNNNENIENQAIESYELIKKAFSKTKYDPDFGEWTKQAVIYLIENNRPDLKQRLYDWGFDIINNEKESIVRSQFIKSYIAEQNKKIDKIIDKQIEDKEIKLIDKIMNEENEK